MGREDSDTFGADIRNETAIIAAALVDSEIRKATTTRITPDTFLVPEHRQIWEVLTEITRRGIQYDHAAAHRLSNGGVRIEYLLAIAGDRPDPPDQSSLDNFLETLFWDKARHTALTGPIATLLDVLKDPRNSPDKAQALGDQVAAALRGYRDRRFLHDPADLVRRQMAEIRKRIQGQSAYPYGIPGLDWYDPDTRERRRMVPGAAPGDLTVLTGVPGGGKSTISGHLALGLGRQRRKVLVGAWEMSAGMTLEILAVLALGWSRTECLVPRTREAPQGGGLREGLFLTKERLDALERKMRQISRYVSFMGPVGVRDPVTRRRRTNDEVLDILRGYVSDVAPDVVIFDLWKRALTQTRPEDEEDAIIRLQEMAKELKFHAIVLHQLRSKDVEARSDPRPTREGLKGSSAYLETADTIIGVNRPSLWKAVDDSTIELYVLKQRFGRWPLQVDFDWVADTGQISGGQHVEYDRTTRAQPASPTGMKAFLGQKGSR